MKTLAVFFMIFVLSGLCLAQNAPSSEDVSVLNASYKIDTGAQKRPDNNDEAVFVQPTDNNRVSNRLERERELIQSQSEPLKLANKQELSLVLLRNNTQKQISLIEYYFIVTNDNDGKEIKKYKLSSKKNIRAGETRTLFNVISGVKRADGLSFTAKITRVKYTDGSVWIP